jgi:hypothetical protein
MHPWTRNFRCIFVSAVIAGILGSGATPASPEASADKSRGWWPQAYSVQRDDGAGTLTVSTPFYAFQHDLKRGGVLTKVVLAHGWSSNLILKPVGRLSTDRK